jgi:hypothetical protein
MRTFVALLVLVFSPAAIGATEPLKLSATQLASKIDHHIGVVLKERKVVAATRSEDAEFVRRIHLDLVGRVPDLLVVRDFLDDPRADKRERLIDKLLDSERYALHWANVWRAWFLPSNDPLIANLMPGFELWLREMLKANTRYDVMTSTILTGDRTTGFNALNIFMQANQSQPENLAASTSRIFLGIKLECAQCHNHPTAKWKRQQFWEFAAFFPSLTTAFTLNPAGMRPIPLVLGRITIPGTDKIVTAKYLDGTTPTEGTADYRQALANWITSGGGTLYFSRAGVNRIWENLLGTGLVEPLAEESSDNPASHPELLDLLARQFKENGYDLKYLIKAIVTSEAYQRTSRQSDPGQSDPRLFARMKVRGLSPEQLYDSLALVVGAKESTPSAAAAGFVNANSARAEFLRRFPNQDKRSEQHTSILQALYLMNGKVVADATSLEKNENLAIIAKGEGVKTSRKVSQLFMIALGRKPTSAESERLIRYVDGGGPTKDSARAICDIFWALLNSSEFSANH